MHGAWRLLGRKEAKRHFIVVPLLGIKFKR
jgi:hypothetical protein